MAFEDLECVKIGLASETIQLAWLALIVGAGTFVTGWLWITVAVRRNLTIGQAGWRGAVAVALIASGIVAVWQSVPLVLPF